MQKIHKVPLFVYNSTIFKCIKIIYLMLKVYPFLCKSIVNFFAVWGNVEMNNDKKFVESTIVLGGFLGKKAGWSTFKRKGEKAESFPV